MRGLATALALAALATVAFGRDDILFRGNYLYRNVLVIDTVDGKITVAMDKSKRTFSLDVIERIFKTVYDPSAPSSITNYTPADFDSLPARALAMPTSRTEYPNLKLLPIALLAWGFSWDCFSQASDAQSGIDAFNRLGLPVEDLESLHTRKLVLAWGSLFIGVTITVISFHTVEVATSSDRIKVSYRF